METLSMVMNRHRSVMARLNRISKQPSLGDLMKLFPESHDGTAKDRERFRKLISDLSGFMKGCEDTSSADLQKLSQLLQENQVLRYAQSLQLRSSCSINLYCSEMLSTAAISTPGIKQTFAKALAMRKARKEEKMKRALVNSEDENVTDDELNKTIFEVSENRKK
ncbi:hypothetical protein OESDEN_05455 [Oesophagostomum dentatum]|uniref:Uncharacterized protein n=1 Tax=Oesophagostomum dentatum TaxID=61180 RepID=A0A0B1TFM9_OESDE|nr:hypothetical protein OESDEN_05455 [Oesophagostomum dentatum]